MVAPWIISHFPEHETYTEPFCGAASVLLRKPLVNFEVINDLFDEIPNLFRVLRDPNQSEALVGLLMLTPFARKEFEDAYEHTDDPIEKARRLIIRSLFGHGSSGIYKASSGFRSRFFKTNTHPSRDFKNYPDHLIKTIERLRRVVIENKPAIEILEYYDSETTLHYLDPPYPHETRNAKHKYAFEMSEEDHIELAETIKKLKGMVVLSSYENDLYDEIFKGWAKDTYQTRADGNQPRTEVIWMNERAYTGQPQLDLERAIQ